MKRSELRDFVKAGVNAITPALDFSEGLITNFNSERSNRYPCVHSIHEETNTQLTISAPQDEWPVKLVIAKKDLMDSLPDQYEPIVDECDEIAQKLVYKYRNVISGYKLITMNNIRRTKFVKKYADCLTGVELTFTINAPDKTNVC